MSGSEQANFESEVHKQSFPNFHYVEGQCNYVLLTKDGTKLKPPQPVTKAECFFKGTQRDLLDDCSLPILQRPPTPPSPSHPRRASSFLQTDFDNKAAAGGGWHSSSYHHGGDVSPAASRDDVSLVIEVKGFHSFPLTKFKLKMNLKKLQNDLKALDHRLEDLAALLQPPPQSEEGAVAAAAGGGGDPVILVKIP